MNNTEYLVALPEDRDDVVDFGNYVFSQAHVPHDFKVLLPKVYADHREIGAKHFIARRDGRIRGMVACMPLDLHVQDRTLHTGFVGTVSVHPYSRGEGHMKRLMPMMIEDAREDGCDMLILGGQRQRYNYFGFDKGGVGILYTVTATNLRHKLGDTDVSNITFSEITEERPEEVDFAHSLYSKRPLYGERPRDSFMDIMHSWKSNLRLIRMDGEMVGYVMGTLRTVRELTLTDEDLLPKVLKALTELDGASADIVVAPYEADRIRVLSTLCERCVVQSLEMINVLKWQPVLEAFLQLKASYAPMADGCVTIAVDGGCYTMRVENGKASVTCEDRKPDMELSHLDAIRLLFGLENTVCANPMPLGWLPLPFYFLSADGF